MRRIIDPASQSTLMFAFSHGTSSPEVLEGLENPESRFLAARDGGADCIFIAPGLIHSLAPLIRESRDLGIVAKITSTASRGGERHQERLIASVEHCAELGVDGVVAMIPFAPENEPDVIELTAQIGEACERLGMPYIAEAEFPNAYYDSGDDYATEWGLPYLKRSARLCAELGADIVKSNWPGSAEEFAEIVECVSVPVVVAGGSREGDLDLLQKIAAARGAGAVGCSVGRNIFQHDEPAAMVAALSAVVRGRLVPRGGARRQLQGEGRRVKAVVLNAEMGVTARVGPNRASRSTPSTRNASGRSTPTSSIRNPSASSRPVDDPSEPGPREMILKVGACGICGSDVHMFETDDEGYMFLPYHLATPVVTGHEFAGKVVAIGSEVREFEVGDLVTAEEIQWCGECDACRGGYWNQCRYIEDLGFTIDGGFAEYAKVNAKYCWSLNSVLERYGDKNTALEVGSMTEPVSVAYEGMFTRAGGFLPGGAVAVFGGGPIGLAATALAKAAGASKVFAFEPLKERREPAKSSARPTASTRPRSTSASTSPRRRRATGSRWRSSAPATSRR